MSRLPEQRCQSADFVRRRLIPLSIKHEAHGLRVNEVCNALQCLGRQIFGHLGPQPRVELASIHAAIRKLKIRVIDGEQVNHASSIA